MQYQLPFLVESPPDEAAPPQHPPGRERYIVLGGQVVPYRFRRSARRTIGLLIDERGLHAAAPRWVTLAEVEAFIREKERWILKHLQGRRPSRPHFLWQDGARLPYLGREVVLHCVDGAADDVRLCDDRLEVPMAAPFDPAALRDRVIAWIKREALVLYRSRIGQLAPRLGVPAPEVALSRARTQWGCCTRKRDGSARILLNWKLMHFELPLIDYVVAHELAHLRHMNHSPAFWREVARLYPDYQRAREALRTRGHLIPEL
ncbi:MAG: M48 family metallopeptidase [Burkholderiales bacterium]|nr:M48 family metallopeptidase [Burkholderiales bacterium]PZN04083.1 MAG: metal-dependent hydrolase [Pseudomonadota bacterium]